ncbi:hypothetical protein JVT61DRAFT_2765 [Boletus reticuloceps]|uniref:Uncharacterized protein n=1 Tax=Boletus reticuloceps TaxID=495285 RepID=A0A8I2YQE4_9AGAM|nr:hypothetical protein JVT61DRAFT_2765 [Boletus reticuloceps]
MPCLPSSLIGVSELATQAVKTMTEHPELLKFSLFALECINLKGQQHKSSSSPHLPGSPALSDLSSMSSRLSTLTFASDVTAVSEYGPDVYKRTSYYNGITGDDDHPDLVYRSDYFTTLFPRPIGRHTHLPVKSLRGVFNTPLNGVWDTVSPQIRDLIKAHRIHWSSIDPAHFFTHGPPGEEVKGSLGPVVIWVGVLPGSTSPDTAHDVSQKILTLLVKNRVDGAVVEWHEAVPQASREASLSPNQYGRH